MFVLFIAYKPFEFRIRRNFILKLVHTKWTMTETSSCKKAY